MHRAFTLPSLEETDNCSACGNSSSGHHTGLGYPETFFGLNGTGFPTFGVAKANVSHGQACQNASLRIIMVPAYGGEYLVTIGLF